MDRVGDWLTGAWRRSYIRRAKTGSRLGRKDSSVDVIYVQTPEAFVDIRRPAGKPGKVRSKEAKTLAFGGVTSTLDNNNGDKMVYWHSCIDMDWKGGEYGSQKSSSAWTAADAGMPLETEDIGVFQCIQTTAPQKWLETDLGTTLEEEWVKVVDAGPYLSLRRGNDLLVVAANRFALASREAFVAGTIEKDKRWIIELSASDRKTEGTPLVLEGSPTEWEPLPSSSSSSIRIRYNERSGWEVGGACFPYPQFKSRPNSLDSRGQPELHSPPRQNPVLKALKVMLLSLISLLVLPIMFVLVLFSVSARDTFQKVFLSNPLQREAVHDEEQTERVWQAPSGRYYAQSVEWQEREGFCSSTTRRCLLKSCNVYLENMGHSPLPIPASMGGPDTPEGFQTKIQKLLEDAGQAERAAVRVLRGGNKGEDDYEAFLEVLKLSVHPSGKYRVAVNYLRSALFGCQNYFPSTILLSFLGGHFSPVVGFWESPVHGAQSEPMCAVFDVNQEYGMCILPCKRLYDASSTFDIMTGRRRGLIVMELNVAK